MSNNKIWKSYKKLFIKILHKILLIHVKKFLINNLILKYNK